jgi:hypothetical protein
MLIVLPLERMSEQNRNIRSNQDRLRGGWRGASRRDDDAEVRQPLVGEDLRPDFTMKTPSAGACDDEYDERPALGRARAGASTSTAVSGQAGGGTQNGPSGGEEGGATQAGVGLGGVTGLGAGPAAGGGVGNTGSAAANGAGAGGPGDNSNPPVAGTGGAP